jgi:periplasmic divalent cation tolerance protein
MIVVLTTAPDRALANTLADGLVREKLAACVQIMPQMTSVYFWLGDVQRDEEYLLLIKTTAERYAAVESFIRQNHTYDVPEIAAVPVEKLSDAYRVWLEGYVNE